MGRLATCCKCTSVLFFIGLVIFVLALFLLPCMPPYVHFPDYNAVESPSALNTTETVLNHVQRVLDGELRGPEALAFRQGDDETPDQLFTGLLDGRVVRMNLSQEDDNSTFTTVTRLGHDECVSESEGERCGRPTGLKFHTDGKLYVLDAYHGLYRVDVDTGAFEHLSGGAQRLGGERVRLACGLDVAQDGRVFWSDASTQAGPKDVLLELLAESSGRLLRYDPSRNRSDILIPRVHCATGVVLAHDETFVLVAEAGKDRILRYHLKGDKAGRWDVFTEGLPGVPTSLQRRGPMGTDGFLVTLGLIHPSSLQFLRNHASIRKALMRLLAATETTLAAMNNLINNDILTRAVYLVGNIQLVAPLLRGGAVIALNDTGHLVDSYKSDDGGIGVISQIETVGDFMYFASPYNPYLGRLNLTDALKNRFLGLQTDDPETTTRTPTSVDDDQLAVTEVEPWDLAKTEEYEIGEVTDGPHLETVHSSARADIMDDFDSTSTDLKTTLRPENFGSNWSDLKSTTPRPQNFGMSWTDQKTTSRPQNFSATSTERNTTSRQQNIDTTWSDLKITTPRPQNFGTSWTDQKTTSRPQNFSTTSTERNTASRLQNFGTSWTDQKTTSRPQKFDTTSTELNAASRPQNFGTWTDLKTTSRPQYFGTSWRNLRTASRPQNFGTSWTDLNTGFRPQNFDTKSTERNTAPRQQGAKRAQTPHVISPIPAMPSDDASSETTTENSPLEIIKSVPRLEEVVSNEVCPTVVTQIEPTPNHKTLDHNRILTTHNVISLKYPDPNDGYV